MARARDNSKGKMNVRMVTDLREDVSTKLTSFLNSVENLRVSKG
jgi:hypothetical protein